MVPSVFFTLSPPFAARFLRCPFCWLVPPATLPFAGFVLRSLNTALLFTTFLHLHLRMSRRTFYPGMLYITALFCANSMHTLCVHTCLLRILLHACCTAGSCWICSRHHGSTRSFGYRCSTSLLLHHAVFTRCIHLCSTLHTHHALVRYASMQSGYLSWRYNGSFSVAIWWWWCHAFFLFTHHRGAVTAHSLPVSARSLLQHFTCTCISRTIHCWIWVLLLCIHQYCRYRTLLYTAHRATWLHLCTCIFYRFFTLLELWFCFMILRHGSRYATLHCLHVYGQIPARYSSSVVIIWFSSGMEWIRYAAGCGSGLLHLQYLCHVW